MGDSISPSEGEQVRFRTRMIALENAYPEVIRDGDLTTLVDAAPIRNKDKMCSFDYPSDLQEFEACIAETKTPYGLYIFDRGILPTSAACSRIDEPRLNTDSSSISLVR
jgi:hypothetical protein